jgi:hypothetical protein
MILLELKSVRNIQFAMPEIEDGALRSLFQHVIKPVEWDETQLAAMEQEILNVFPRPEILMPDDVRGTAASLREAVLIRGWPELDAVRGRVMFALINGGEILARYLGKTGDWRGRLLFVNVGPEHPAAAWMMIDDPLRYFDLIQVAVCMGFVVRTRGDAGLDQARAADGRRRDRALDSGAQYISTDFPDPDARYSDYHVQLPGGGAARLNPISSPMPPPVCNDDQRLGPRSRSNSGSSSHTLPTQ